MRSQYFIHQLWSPLQVIVLCCFAFIAMLLPPGTARGANGDDAQERPYECIASYNEVINSYARHDHYVFLDQGYTLRVLDIIDPAHPKEIGWLRLDSEIDSMAIKWPVLYVGCTQGAGGRIIDVSNPSHPQLKGSFECGTRTLFVKIIGSYLFASGRDMGMIEYKVFDIRDLFHPIERLEGGRKPYNSPERSLFATEGSRLFKLQEGETDEDGNTRTAILDITTSPTTLGCLTLPAGSTEPDESCSVFWIRDGKLIAGDTKTTLTLAEVSPSATVMDYMYTGGIGILQDGPPAKPEKIAIAEIKKNSDESKVDHTLRIFENIAGSSPTLRSVYGAHAGAEQFRIAGKRGYLVDGDGGVQILDMTDPARPRRLGRITGLDAPIIRAIEDDLVFIGGAGFGIRVFDCANPGSPTPRGKYHGQDGPMSIQGKRAFVASGKEGLKILDLGDLAAIKVIGQFPTEEPSIDLATSGSLVYLMAGNLLIVDTADPAKPRLISSTPVIAEDESEEWLNGENPVMLKRLGPALYVIHREKSGHARGTACKVIDVSDPAHPRPRKGLVYAEPPDPEGDAPSKSNSADDSAPDKSPASHVSFPGWVLCLPSSYYNARSWDSVYERMMTFFDLSNPLNPAAFSLTSAMQTAGGAALYKNTLYLADGPGGLVILRQGQSGD